MAISASEYFAPLAVVLSVLVEIFVRPLQTLYTLALTYDLMAWLVLTSMVVLAGVVLYYSVTGDKRPGG